MESSKIVKYALIGTAALVGAAVAYQFFSKGEESEADDALEGDLAQLGPLELDGSGNIEFRQFLKIFQICSFYGKTQFAIKKKDYIARRRQALKDNNKALYEQIVIEMTQAEENLVQTKLIQILDRLGISEEDFQKSTMFHARDQRKGMQIMQMQQQTIAGDLGSENSKVLNKEEAIRVFKIQQDIQMESMEAMMKEGMHESQSEEGQMQMMMRMMTQQAMSTDKLFDQTGVEEEELHKSITANNL